MSQEDIMKEVITFAEVCKRIIQVIVLLYVSSAQTFIVINIPIGVSIVFIGAVIGWVACLLILNLNEVTAAKIQIMLMRAEQEKQVALAKQTATAISESVDENVRAIVLDELINRGIVIRVPAGGSG